MQKPANRSGIITQDFSSMNIQQRMAQGRDIGEDFIRKQLAMHGIEIEPAQGYHADARLKIDGYWNGEPVQIKLRRSGKDARNDIAYEVCRNHKRDMPLSQQLKDEHQQGRDFKGQVKHYFVMNRDETEIYHCPASHLKTAVLQAIREIPGGRLSRPYQSQHGVDLRPTRDPDPNSFTPYKVMAFIPAEMVATDRIPIKAVA